MTVGTDSAAPVHYKGMENEAPKVRVMRVRVTREVPEIRVLKVKISGPDPDAPPIAVRVRRFSQE